MFELHFDSKMDLSTGENEFFSEKNEIFSGLCIL